MATVVAVCRRVPIRDLYAVPMAAAGHTLLAPDEVTDPADVTAALAFLPPPGAFAPYPNLRLVASIGAGVETILAADPPPSVAVVRTVDPEQPLQMAAFALFHIVLWHRRLDLTLAAQARAQWARPQFGRSPRVETVGVLGAGASGRRIAAAASALGYPTRLYSRRRADVAGVRAYAGSEREEFLAGTTILVAVLPGTPETRGLIDASFLRQLPRGAALIQIGRGGQVVEDDLLALLDAGHLRGASMDVFATEPLPPESPFWADARVIVTPHTASEASAAATVSAVTDGLAALDRGEPPPGLVDRALGY
jgi:phosphoglycerate dehydrogenase-like enzyme